MKRFQSKNIVIFILLLANIYLSGILLQRHWQQSLSQERSTQEIITLFENQGVSLSPDLILWDEPLPCLELTLNASLCQSIAQDLLGASAALTSDDTTIYENENGVASFGQDGSLYATGLLGSDDGANYLQFIEDFCYTYGYENPVVVLNDSSGTVTATATYRGIAVDDISLTFTIDEGVITAIGGTVLPQTHSATGSSAQVTCITALSRFLTMRRTTGAIISTVEQVEVCYLFSSSASTPISLIPMWKIATDGGVYTVNAMTGVANYG